MPSSKKGATVWLEWADGSLVRDFDNRPVFTGCQIVWADPAKRRPPEEMPAKVGETPAAGLVVELVTEDKIMVRWLRTDAISEVYADCVRVIQNPPPYVPKHRKKQ